MDTTPQKPPKHEIQSPFVECVTQCRSSMRKLRKKIYKHIKYNPDYHKTQTSSFNLSHSLKHRNIPQQILVKLKSRHQLDFSALDYSDIQNILPFSEVKKCADRQQNETRQILQEWKNTANIEKQSQFSKSQTKKSKKRWLISTQMQNEESQIGSNSCLMQLQGKELFVSCFDQLNNDVKISGNLHENSLLQICSNIFEESQLYQFK